MFKLTRWLVLTWLVAVSLPTTQAAQPVGFSAGFEPPLYDTGIEVAGQDGWTIDDDVDDLSFFVERNGSWAGALGGYYDVPLANGVTLSHESGLLLAGSVFSVDVSIEPSTALFPGRDSFGWTFTDGASQTLLRIAFEPNAGFADRWEVAWYDSAGTRTSSGFDVFGEGVYRLTVYLASCGANGAFSAHLTGTNTIDFNGVLPGAAASTIARFGADYRLIDAGDNYLIFDNLVMAPAAPYASTFEPPLYDTGIEVAGQDGWTIDDEVDDLSFFVERNGSWAGALGGYYDVPLANEVTLSHASGLSMSGSAFSVDVSIEPSTDLFPGRDAFGWTFMDSASQTLLRIAFEPNAGFADRWEVAWYDAAGTRTSSGFDVFDTGVYHLAVNFASCGPDGMFAAHLTGTNTIDFSGVLPGAAGCTIARFGADYRLTDGGDNYLIFDNLSMVPAPPFSATFEPPLYDTGIEVAGQNGWTIDDEVDDISFFVERNGDWAGALGGYYDVPLANEVNLAHAAGLPLSGSVFAADVSIEPSTALFPGRDSFGWTFTDSANQPLLRIAFEPNAGFADRWEVAWYDAAGTRTSSEFDVFGQGVYHLVVSFSTSGANGAFAAHITGTNTVHFNGTLPGAAAATISSFNADYDLLDAGDNYMIFDNVIMVSESMIATMGEWRMAWFGTTDDAGSAASLADPDADGVPNLLEFALGLNPLQNSADQVPEGVLEGGDFVLRVTQPPCLTGITLGAEWSPSLQSGSWTPVPDSGAGDQSVFRVTVGVKPAVFMRLIVTQP